MLGHKDSSVAEEREMVLTSLVALEAADSVKQNEAEHSGDAVAEFLLVD